MPLPLLLAGFALSLGAALFLVPLWSRIARRAGWVDRPDGRRKIHAAPVPNVGGLAIAGAFFLGAVAMSLAWMKLPGGYVAALTPPPVLVILGAVLITLVGFVDDLKDISFRSKFVAQLVVTAMAFAGGYRIGLFDGVLGEGALALGVSFALTALWMVGVMNAVNLIDGIDGLAAGVVAIALVGLAGVHAVGGDYGSLVLVIAMVGALAGFLRYNTNPATVFMGDSGSLLLGYVLGAYALRGTAHTDPVLQLVIPAVVMGVPILDTLISMGRRKYAGRPLFYPDKEHIHHRLAASMPVRSAVLRLYGLGAFLALGALAMAAAPRGLAYALFALGSLAVYAFLYRYGCLPAPQQATELARRREAVQRAARIQERVVDRVARKRTASDAPGALVQSEG